jgi:hypothetical protein
VLAFIGIMETTYIPRHLPNYALRMGMAEKIRHNSLPRTMRASPPRISEIWMDTSADRPREKGS